MRFQFYMSPTLLLTEFKAATIHTVNSRDLLKNALAPFHHNLKIVKVSLVAICAEFNVHDLFQNRSVPMALRLL